MTRAKQRHDFDQVAELRAHMSNMFRAEGSRPIHPWSFHPFRKPPQRKQKRSTCTVQQLISAFVGL